MGKRRTGKPLASGAGGPDKAQQAQMKLAGRGSFGGIMSGVIGMMTGDIWDKKHPLRKGGQGWSKPKPQPQSNLDEDKMDTPWKPTQYEFNTPYSQRGGRDSKSRRRSSYNW